MAVTDGSYIKEHHPELCSAAFVLECTKGRGRLVGAFAEASVAANAYRGELLGLMAVHLLLLAVETVSPGLRGTAAIYSDCIGALGRVAKLPPYLIPSQCRHLDIIKTIMVNCASLSFDQEYHHVAVHQDDHTLQWKDLTQAAQLNSARDAGAKAILRSQDVTNLPSQEAFPLEPICITVEGKKMTSDTGAHIRYILYVASKATQTSSLFLLVRWVIVVKHILVLIVVKKICLLTKKQSIANSTFLWSLINSVGTLTILHLNL